jgi:hypothetical protein
MRFLISFFFFSFKFLRSECSAIKCQLIFWHLCILFGWLMLVLFLNFASLVNFDWHLAPCFSVSYLLHHCYGCGSLVIYQVLFVSPERFLNAEFLSILSPIPISLLVVDEAHCISEW